MLDQIFEKYATLSIQVKAIALLLLGLLSGYLSYSDCVEAAQKNLQQAKTADDQLSNELANFNKTGQSLASIEAQKRKAEEEFTILFELLPRDVEIEKLLANFADAARDTGIAMVKFIPQMNPDATTSSAAAQIATQTTAQATPAAEEKGKSSATSPKAQAANIGSQFTADSLKRIPVSVSLEGTYPQVTAFFEKILSLPRIVRIDNFSFSPATQLVSVRVPNADNASATKTRVDPNGSPILKVDSQFVAYMQRVDEQNLPTFSAPSTPPPLKVSGEPAPSPAGMTAKPLPAGGTP